MCVRGIVHIDDDDDDDDRVATISDPIGASFCERTIIDRVFLDHTS